MFYARARQGSVHIKKIYIYLGKFPHAREKVNKVFLDFPFRTVTYQGAISDDISAEIEDSEGHKVRDVTTMTQNGVKQIHFTPSQAGTFRIKAFLRDEEVKGRSPGDSELRSQQTPSTGLRHPASNHRHN